MSAGTSTRRAAPSSKAQTPPRVLFVSHSAGWKGPSRSLLLLLDHLANRVEPVALLPGDGPLRSALEERGIRTVTQRSFTKWSIPRLWAMVRREKPDLVYGNCLSGITRNVLLAARLAGTPVVMHVREMARPGNRSAYFLRWANGVVAVSEASARAASSYVGGVPIVVAHNGVPADRSALDPERRAVARARLLEVAGLDREPGCLLLSAGSFCERKGQLHQIRAWAEAARVVEGVLLLFGEDVDPAYARLVHELVEARQLGDRVRFGGFRPDLPELLPGADAFVHTPAFDPHPRAVLEAMAAGLPVVAYAIDGVSETVDQGKSGFLAEPGDESSIAQALCRVAKDPKLRQTMGHAAFEAVADRFTPGRTAETVWDVIHGITRG